MSETMPRNHSELDEFDLHDLALLAPTDLSAAAPEWKVRRDALLDGIAPSARANWWLRAGVAAAAVTIVAGTAFALNRPEQAVPAGPTTAASTAARETVAGARRPAPGHWLVRREQQVIFQSNMTPRTQTATAMTALGADGEQVSWYGKQEGTRGPVDDYVNPTGAPLETAPLRTWLTTRTGVIYSSASPSPKGPPQPEADSTWAAISNYSVAISTPRELRRAMVEVARILPSTKVAQQGGEIRLRHTSVEGRTTTVEDLVVDATSHELKRHVLDSRIPATTTEPRNPAIHLRYETTYQPVVEVAGEPKP